MNQRVLAALVLSLAFGTVTVAHAESDAPAPKAEKAMGSAHGGADNDGDKDKKGPKPLFIDRLDVRVPLSELLAGNQVVHVQVDAFGGTIRGSAGVNSDGMFVNGKIEQLILGRLASLGQTLPMTGSLALSVKFKAPWLKPPPGAPPTQPGVPPEFDILHATGLLEIKLKDYVIGDGKTKLVVPEDPFLAQGFTYPRLWLGDLGGRLVVDRGRATIDGLHSKSPDAELWLDGYVELRDPLQMSELHLYLRFLPSAQLIKREPVIAVLNQAMGTGRRPDGALGFAMFGSLATPWSRPAKDPPEGVTARGGPLDHVSSSEAPLLRPGGGLVGGALGSPPPLPAWWPSATTPPPAVAIASTEPMPGEATGLEKDIDKGVRCNGASCEVDRSLIDKVLANTTALATSARFVPSIKDGKPNGFKLYAIRPGSIFAKIGMQNADLIKAINGLDMSTPDKALEAYSKLKTASHLTVMLERRGENITLDYQIR